MARRKAGEASPGPGHNGGPSRATFLEHVDNIVDKLAVKRSADSALATAYKAAEKDGLDRKDLKFAIAEGGLSSDERELRHRRRMQYLEFLGKPVGTQTDMFTEEAADQSAGEGDPEAAAEDEAAVARHELNVAFNQGSIAGKAGAQAASNPYQPGSEQAQSWSTGWSAGQKEFVTSTLGGATRRAPAPEVTA